MSSTSYPLLQESVDLSKTNAKTEKSQLSEYLSGFNTFDFHLKYATLSEMYHHEMTPTISLFLNICARQAMPRMELRL